MAAFQKEKRIRSKKQEEIMQSLYVGLFFFVALWGGFFKFLSLYARRMGACSGWAGRFFLTTLGSLLVVVAVFLLAELLPRLYGGIMNLF